MDRTFADTTHTQLESKTAELTVLSSREDACPRKHAPHPGVQLVPCRTLISAVTLLAQEAPMENTLAAQGACMRL